MTDHTVFGQLPRESQELLAKIKAEPIKDSQAHTTTPSGLVQISAAVPSTAWSFPFRAARTKASNRARRRNRG